MANQEPSSDLNAQIETARAAYVKSLAEPRASSFTYDAETDFLSFQLISGAIYKVPRMLIQGLQKAKSVEISAGYLSPDGSSIHWDNLDIDFSIKGLLNGRFGTQAWCQSLEELG